MAPHWIKWPVSEALKAAPLQYLGPPRLPEPQIISIWVMLWRRRLQMAFRAVWQLPTSHNNTRACSCSEPAVHDKHRIHLTETSADTVINKLCICRQFYSGPPAPRGQEWRCAVYTNCLFSWTALNLIRPQTLMPNSPVEHNGLGNAMNSASLPLCFPLQRPPHMYQA